MESLLFIYNAKSDYWSKKIDFAHKILSPSTYMCDLCTLTHGVLGETEIWKIFTKASYIDMEFMYKDKFQELYPEIDTDFPAVLKKEHSSIKTFLDAEALAKIKSVEDLIATVEANF